jgi:hypothetical protein
MADHKFLAVTSRRLPRSESLSYKSRCSCGWTSSGFVSAEAASAAFDVHVSLKGGGRPVTVESETNRVSDEIAELLGVDPEEVLVEPRQGRISLTLAQAQALLDLCR